MGKLVKGVWVDWIDKVKILQKAVIQNNEGKLLALLRPEKEYIRPNCWDLCGGSVDFEDVERWKSKSGKGDKDDILIKGIKREALEETGLKVKTLEVIHVSSGYNNKKGVYIVAIGYLCKVDGNYAVKLSKEHVDYKWVTKQEFLRLNVGDDGGLIKSIIKKC
ncbi:MAG: NUDIX domain-containing protein [archaeon]|nr:NUDIX domain-containing protein [archaeon]